MGDKFSKFNEFKLKKPHFNLKAFRTIMAVSSATIVAV